MEGLWLHLSLLPVSGCNVLSVGYSHQKRNAGDGGMLTSLRRRAGFSGLIELPGSLEEEPLERARIFLADDHAEFLSLAAGLIEAEYEVLKTFDDGEAVVRACTLFEPDLLVLDITMPGIGGIETARRIRAAGCNVKIVFVTVHDDTDYLRSALRVGAQGYVVKDRLVSDLIPAIRAALAGERFVSNTLALKDDVPRSIRM